MRTYGQEAYDFLKQFSIPRVSGSPAERQAAEQICEKVRSFGLTPKLESFTVTSNPPVLAEFSLTEPEQVAYEVTGLIGAKDTEEQEVAFYYLRDVDEIGLRQAGGKFVLLNARPGEQEYEKLQKAGVVGFLLMNGTSRDTRENSDLDTLRFRENYVRYGSMPAFAMRMTDALDLLHRDPGRVRFRLKTEEITVTSQNVVVEIPGTDLADEAVAFGAHYDSTEFSHGAWDNGAGVVQVLGLLRHLSQNPPRRTVKAIFFGSEEVGLKGSRAYLEAHAEAQDSLLAMVNIDVGGSYLGKEMMVLTGTQGAEEYLRGLLYEAGYSARLSSGVMSSDSAVFSDYGIPSISLGQFPPQGGGYMHTRYDNISMISRSVLDRETEFLIFLAGRLLNAQVFPIPRVIPATLREKLKSYFGKGLSHTETVTEFPPEPEPSKPLF